MPIAAKLRGVTYYEGVPPIKSHDPLITWSSEITWQTKNITPTAMPVTTRPDRIVTYLGWLLPIKSHDHLILWSFGDHTIN